MKTSFAVLFMVFCAIMVEKIMSRYLLIDMDQDQAPKQTEEERVAEVLAMATKCCEDSDVPESCLGLCSPTDAMSRSILGESLNACAKYKASIEKCFEPVVQEILKKDGKEGEAELAQLGARFGAVPGAKKAAKAGSKASPKGKKAAGKGKNPPPPIKGVKPPVSKPRDCSVDVPEADCSCTHGGIGNIFDMEGCRIDPNKPAPPCYRCHCKEWLFACSGSAVKCPPGDQYGQSNHPSCSGCSDRQCCLDSGLQGNCKGYEGGIQK